MLRVFCFLSFMFVLFSQDLCLTASKKNRWKKIVSVQRIGKEQGFYVVLEDKNEFVIGLTKDPGLCESCIKRILDSRACITDDGQMNIEEIGLFSCISVKDGYHLSKEFESLSFIYPLHQGYEFFYGSKGQDSFLCCQKQSGQIFEISNPTYNINKLQATDDVAGLRFYRDQANQKPFIFLALAERSLFFINRKIPIKNVYERKALQFLRSNNPTKGPHLLQTGDKRYNTVIQFHNNITPCFIETTFDGFYLVDQKQRKLKVGYESVNGKNLKGYQLPFVDFLTLDEVKGAMMMIDHAIKSLISGSMSAEQLDLLLDEVFDIAKSFNLEPNREQLEEAVSQIQGDPQIQKKVLGLYHKMKKMIAFKVGKVFKDENLYLVYDQKKESLLIFTRLALVEKCLTCLGEFFAKVT